MVSVRASVAFPRAVAEKVAGALELGALARTSTPTRAQTSTYTVVTFRSLRRRLNTLTVESESNHGERALRGARGRLSFYNAEESHVCIIAILTLGACLY